MNVSASAMTTPPSPPPAPEPLVRVRGLCKYFPIRGKGILSKVVATVRAVDDLNFDLFPGETLGLVGESGSGKTTAARCLLRALDPTAGDVLFRTPGGATVNLATLPERALKPLRPHLQMIFQDPYSSLNPRMTVGEIVAEPLLIHRMGTRREQEERVVDILRRVGLKAEHRTRYPHAFSGGQRQRIGIARALIMRPSFIVADEAVSALDVSVQAQVLNLLGDIRRTTGVGLVFVSHDLAVVRYVCETALVMRRGEVVEAGNTRRLLDDPQHPYTRLLLDAVPRPGWDPDGITALRRLADATDAAPSS